MQTLSKYFFKDATKNAKIPPVRMIQLVITDRNGMGGVFYMEEQISEFEKEVSMLNKFKNEYLIHFYGAVNIPNKYVW